MDIRRVDQLGFGKFFCSKMLTAHYENSKWGELRLTPLRPIEIHPAAKVFHYGQEVFEGLKAFLQKDGKIAIFRPQENIRRMTRSAGLLAMPPFPEDRFLEGIKELTKECKEFVPEAPGALYLRPTLIGSTPTLGVAPSTEYIFYVLASPVGGYFGSTQLNAPPTIRIRVTNDTARAAKKSIGSAKAGGNYAASLRILRDTRAEGFNDVLFLDSIENKYIEELSGMNVFVVADGVLKTPPLGDSILAGVTRDSILKIAKNLSLSTKEVPLSIHEIVEGLRNKSVSELFACGTAAVVTGITELSWKGETLRVGSGEAGPQTRKLYETLTSIHYGTVSPPDPSWLCYIR